MLLRSKGMEMYVALFDFNFEEAKSDLVSHKSIPLLVVLGSLVAAEFILSIGTFFCELNIKLLLIQYPIQCIHLKRKQKQSWVNIPF